MGNLKNKKKIKKTEAEVIKKKKCRRKQAWFMIHRKSKIGKG